LLITACQEDTPTTNADISIDDAQIIEETFNRNIDLENPYNYANQDIPNYIDDNTEGNPITNEGAALGPALFYDTKLSVTKTVSCASCHQQEVAFGDVAQLSQGVNGLTGRHSMRLINARFADEDNFFWDERANSLENQTTQPIQDHVEMGFSGQNGDPDINDLIDILSAEEYYRVLFTNTFGNETITEQRMQNALAQFIRSIQSFDSRYDAGRATVNNNNQPFPNFTNQENQGKQLFNGNPQFQGGSGVRVGGGLGCQACHQAPEFDIRQNSGNNGVTNVASNSAARDFDVTRSPTLRDMFDPNGNLNGLLMHTGDFTIEDMLDHYNSIDAQDNPNLDNRLARGGGVQLNMTQAERDALVAFLKTLTGTNVYTDEKWSDPYLVGE